MLEISYDSLNSTRVCFNTLSYNRSENERRLSGRELGWLYFFGGIIIRDVRTFHITPLLLAPCGLSTIIFNIWLLAANHAYTLGWLLHLGSGRIHLLG